MNVSLPASMKDYVDARVQESDYSSASEYLRELIRGDQERHRLRSLLLAGGESPLVTEGTNDFFARMRSAAGA